MDKIFNVLLSIGLLGLVVLEVYLFNILHGIVSDIKDMLQRDEKKEKLSQKDVGSFTWRKNKILNDYNVFVSYSKEDDTLLLNFDKYYTWTIRLLIIFALFGIFLVNVPVFGSVYVVASFIALIFATITSFTQKRDDADKLESLKREYFEVVTLLFGALGMVQFFFARW